MTDSARQQDSSESASLSRAGGDGLQGSDSSWTCHPGRPGGASGRTVGQPELRVSDGLTPARQDRGMSKSVLNGLMRHWQERSATD